MKKKILLMYNVNRGFMFVENCLIVNVVKLKILKCFLFLMCVDVG